MKQIMIRSVIVGAITFGTALSTYAGHDHDRCTRLLSGASSPGDLRVFGSGQDGDLQPRLREAARIIYHEIAPKLGLKIPPTTIRFITATDMAALSSNAGHPAPHWSDGAKVAGGAKHAAGILEFVVPGQPVHHQFVRDTNNFHDSLIVLAHVAGHYDFAENFPNFQERKTGQIRYSHELAQLMTRLYPEVGHEEVSEFYHRLLSLAHMQDLSRGTFTPPEEFVARAADRSPIIERNDSSFVSSDPQVYYPRPDHPWKPTESMLQAFVRNLPPTSEPWKIQLAELFEKLHRAAPAYIQSKIMNEGWATIMEYMILAHSPWNTSADAVAFGQLNQGVNRPELSNPYWLGSQAWLRIRERFFARPEISKLPPIEQDRLFIEEAHRIKRSYNDYTFIRMAFDKTWVDQLNLVLYRKEGQDRHTGEQINLAITRDHQRVVNWISQKIANHELHFPKIELTSFNSRETGAILLKHKPVIGIPLRRDTVAKTLYVLSRVMERPVTLETIGSSLWDPRNTFTIENYPMIITARPDGSVSVDGDSRAQALATYFQKSVDDLRQDISLSYSADRAKADIERYDLATLETNPGLVRDVASLMMHAPTAPQAVLEYLNTVDARMDRSLRLAAQGKWPIKIIAGGKKARLRVLPETPEFELDTSILAARKEMLSPTGPEKRFTFVDSLKTTANLWLEQPSSKSAAASQMMGVVKDQMPDEDLDLTSGHQLPGDRWKSKGQGQGQGQGEGEGDPQDGEEGEPGEQAGEGSGGDPAYAEIPIKKFADILFEELKLRNLRRTDGESQITDDARIGGEKKPEGFVLWDRTAFEALGLGRAMAKKMGKDPRKMTKRELIALGIKYLPPADQVVSSRDTEPQPDIDAVMLFVADTSGSMGPEHQKVERQMVHNTLMILRREYPNIKTRFVIYDSEAREVSEKDFFSRNLGGGTNASSALKLGQKILSEYSKSRYNRFAMLFSDGDDFSNGESIREGEKLAEITEFMAYGHVEPHGDHLTPVRAGNLSAEFEGLNKKNPTKVGFAQLTLDPRSIIDALRAYFGKKP